MCEEGAVSEKAGFSEWPVLGRNVGEAAARKQVAGL